MSEPIRPNCSTCGGTGKHLLGPGPDTVECRKCHGTGLDRERVVEVVSEALYEANDRRETYRHDEYAEATVAALWPFVKARKAVTHG